jgi:inorganic pyrophosphatase
MSLNRVNAGRNPPEDFNVVIEVPMLADPITYEVHKESGALFVDRFLTTATHYPCNHGYIPQTLCGDGDPLDVLVLAPVPLVAGTVVRCRPVALLRTQDENGDDAKVLAAPVSEVCPAYERVRSVEDVSTLKLRQIEHFLQHYKDLEPGKFVRTFGWPVAALAAHVSGSVAMTLPGIGTVPLFRAHLPDGG